MLGEKIKKLYFERLDFLFYKGLQEGKIIPFDDDFYNQLKDTYVSGLPVSIHIKHFKPIIPPGKCYDRSLYMFFCFKDALLVRGDNKCLELEYGKDSAGHGWIEIGDYVYDPTKLMRFDKKLYYQMLKCKKVRKYTHEQYKKANPLFYEDVMNTSYQDFLKGGRKRLDLITVMPIVEATAKLPGNEELLKDLNEFINLIQYDEKELYEELQNKVHQHIKNVSNKC